MSQRKVHLDMSACQTSVVGKLLNKGYYGSGPLRDLIECAPDRSGYPHNGGQHTLHMSGTQEDVLAWLDMFEETTDLELTAVRARLKDRNYPNTVAWHVESELFTHQG